MLRYRLKVDRTVHRLCSSQHAVLNGRGGLFASGRWHNKGHPVVYCASSLSLAIAERLVYEEHDLAPDHLVRIEVTLSAGLFVQQLEPTDLPEDWRAYPHLASTRKIGADWLRGHSSEALVVPSAVVPEESNVILNPLHPDFAKYVEVKKVTPYSIDTRLSR